MKIVNKKLFLIALVFLIIALYFLIFYFPIQYKNLKNYCNTSCSNWNNSNEDCGDWYHIKGCNDSDAPNKTIFGTEIEHKNNWCYELSGGKCGEFGLFHFSHFVFLFILTFVLIFVGLIINSLITNGKRII